MSSSSLSSSTVCGILVLLIISSADEVRGGEGRKVLQNFDYQGVTLDDGSLRRQFDYRRLAETLVPVPGEALSFHLASDPSVLVRPFYQYKAGERYFVYLDPVENKFGNWFDNIRFSPGWADSGEWRAAHVPGATAEFAFEGSGVRILGYYFDDAGRGEVRIDGVVAGVIDQYRPVRGEKTHWDFLGLRAGRHEVKLTVLAKPNPKSTQNHVNLAGFTPLGTGGP